MSIASRIETIEEHISNIYDTLELGGADLTNVDKNIININVEWKNRLKDYLANGIEIIWDNWEKVVGEGTQLSLTPTTKGKMRIELKGNTYQESTTGKNLMDREWIGRTFNGITITNNGDGTYTLNGTSTSNTAFGLQSITGGISAHPLIEKIANNVGKYITISTGYSANQNFYLQLNLSKQTNGGGQYGFVSAVNSYANKLISSNESDVVYMNFFIGINANATFNNVKIYPMITIQDSQITTAPTPNDFEKYTGGIASPNPDYPQDIQVVSGDNTIKVEGKNLFDEDSIEQTSYYIDPTTGNHTATTGSILYKMEVLPNTSYVRNNIKNSSNVTFFSSITYWDKNNNYISGSWNGNQIITTPNNENVKYMILSTSNDMTQYSDTQTYLDNFMIEKGNQATTYEPYVSQSYPINLPVENLFDKNGVDIVQAHMSVSGHTIKLQSGNYTAIFPCKPNTTYTIQKIVSIRFVVMQSPTLLTLTSTTQTIENVQSFGDNTSGTLTTLGTTNYLYIEFYGGSDETEYQQTLDSLQIEKGDKANSYTTYGTTPIELCKKEEYQDKIAKSTGKNLFDKNTMVLNGYVNTTGWALIQNDNLRTAYIPCKPNTTYTISKVQSARFAVASYSSIEFGSVGTNGVNDNSATKLITTTSANAKYLCVFYYHTSDTLSEETIRNSIMIQEGDITTPVYEPYGTGWYLNKQIGKVVLDGSEGEWRLGSVFYNYNALSSKSLIVDIGTKKNIWCNYFKNAYPNVDNTLFTPGTVGEGTTTLWLNSTQFETVSDLTTWLSTHNTIVYYVLATPTYEEITNTTLLSQLNALGNANSYNNQTNISQINNILSFEIDAIALKNI